MATTKEYGPFRIPFVPLDVRYQENEKDFQKVISIIFPDLDISSLKFKEFTGGITNQVIGVFIPDKEEGFVVRLYGRDTERFVSRRNEVIANQVAAACNVGQRVVCLFNNGSCCELLPGRSLAPEEFSDKVTGGRIARAVAMMHVKGEWPEQHMQPLLKSRFFADDWLDLLPQSLDTVAKTEKLASLSSIPL